MLFSTCPISGVTFYLDIGASKSRCRQPHPLLCATVRELMRIDPVSQSDYQLIFSSLVCKLADIGLVHIPSTIPTFGKAELSRELPHLFPFVTWAMQATGAPQFEYLPQFRINADLASFIEWRKEVRNNASQWSTLFDDIEARNLRRQREEALRLLQEPINPKTAKPDNARTARIKSRVAYLQNSLEGRFTSPIVQYYVNILMAPATFEVSNLQQAKETFLDYLPETTLSDWTDKQEIIKIISATIVEKVGLASILGISQNKESLEIVQQIRKENTVFAEGKEFVTTTNKKLALWLAANNGTNPNDYTIPTHTSEPKREDFKSELGFTVAHRQWKEQQS